MSKRKTNPIRITGGKLEMRSIDSIKPYERNARIHGPEQIEQIRKSLRQFGFVSPVLIDSEGNLIAGHGRVEAAKLEGMSEVPCVIADGLTDAQRRAYILADNRLAETSTWDEALLKIELGELMDVSFDLESIGYTEEDLGTFDFSDEQEAPQAQEDAEENERKVLADLFGAPPFSILDSRQGYWIDGERRWTSLGIGAISGRDDNINAAQQVRANSSTGYARIAPGTSRFNAFLCELMYRWFCPPKGLIFDPFAGGDVRGCVASSLGYDYVGIDIRQEQIEANNAVARAAGTHQTYYCDDSKNADRYLPTASVDMVFSCPPYFNLERYSDNPSDLSNMSFDDFSAAYRQIIDVACKTMRENRFAVFVVGDVRDANGFYRGLVDLTKSCFLQNGLMLYNDMVFIERFGTAAMRAETIFKSRKVTKVHQNVLCFYKGDPRAIKTLWECAGHE